MSSILEGFTGKLVTNVNKYWYMCMPIENIKTNKYETGLVVDKAGLMICTICIEVLVPWDLL